MSCVEQNFSFIFTIHLSVMNGILSSVSGSVLHNFPFKSVWVSDHLNINHLSRHVHLLGTHLLRKHLSGQNYFHAIFLPHLLFVICFLLAACGVRTDGTSFVRHKPQISAFEQELEPYCLKDWEARKDSSGIDHGLAFLDIRTQQLTKIFFTLVYKKNLYKIKPNACLKKLNDDRHFSCPVYICSFFVIMIISDASLSLLINNNDLWRVCPLTNMDSNIFHDM